MLGKNGHFSQDAILLSITALQDLSSLMEAITLSNIYCYQPYKVLYPMLQSPDFLCKTGEGAALLQVLLKGDGPVEFRWCCSYLSHAGLLSEWKTS